MKYSIHFRETIGDNYMTRYRLFPVIRVEGEKSFYPPFNIYLHIFYGSDHARALHDHPWPNMSFLIKGSLTEVLDQTTTLDEPPTILKERLLAKFTPYFRKATDKHRLIKNGDGSAITLFFTGIKQRSWGFWPGGMFVPWREYVIRDKTKD